MKKKTEKQMKIGAKHINDFQFNWRNKKKIQKESILLAGC